MDTKADVEEGRSALLSAEEALSVPKVSHVKYNDLIFAIFFAGNILCIIILALSSGSSSLMSNGSKIVSIVGNRREVYSSGINSPGQMIGGTIFVIIIGGILSIAWVFALSRIAAKMINITFAAILSVSAISSFGLLIAGSYLAGLGLLLFSFLAVGLFFVLRSRIAFAAANLKVACAAIRAMPSTVAVAAAALLVQGLFCILWIMAVLGAATNEGSSFVKYEGRKYNLNQCTTYKYTGPLHVGDYVLSCTSGTCNACVCGGSSVAYQGRPCLTQRVYGGVYFGLLLSLLWTSAVVANVVHCTVSGAVATWWYDEGVGDLSADGLLTDAPPISSSGKEEMVPVPAGPNTTGQNFSSIEWMSGAINRLLGSERSRGVVRASLLRALTTSFGSICLGSLVVAVLRALRAVVSFSAQRLKKLDNIGGQRIRLMILSILESMLLLLDRAVSYFNRYAFCYVAIYGFTFLEASQTVVTMFRDRGLSALLNDDIIDTVLLVAHTIGGIVCLLLGYAFSSAAGLSAVNTSLLTALGFFVGFLMFLITLKAVSSAVTTVYVCFAERPDIFANSHPYLHAELSEAWRNLCPRQTDVRDIDSDRNGKDGHPPRAHATPSTIGSTNDTRTNWRSLGNPLSAQWVSGAYQPPKAPVPSSAPSAIFTDDDSLSATGDIDVAAAAYGYTWATCKDTEEIHGNATGVTREAKTQSSPYGHGGADAGSGRRQGRPQSQESLQLQSSVAYEDFMGQPPSTAKTPSNRP